MACVFIPTNRSLRMMGDTSSQCYAGDRSHMDGGMWDLARARRREPRNTGGGGAGRGGGRCITRDASPLFRAGCRSRVERPRRASAHHAADASRRPVFDLDERRAILVHRCAIEAVGRGGGSLGLPVAGRVDVGGDEDDGPSEAVLVAAE